MRNTRRQNIIGPTIRKIRIDQGLSQEALTVKCNILGWALGRATLAKIESKIRRVNDAETSLLAAALKVPVSSLFERHGAAITIPECVEVARNGEM